VVVQSEPKEAPETAAVVGRVKVIQGSVSIVHADGRKTLVTGQPAELHERDRVESGHDGLALVNFEGGNKLHVHPDTEVEVKEYQNPKVEESRKALLHLIRGKIRNQVEQKYNGKTSYYRVSTKAAVAGVRGTDFLVEHHEDVGLETKVATFAGKVIFASLDEKQAVEIARGEGATFTADLPTSNADEKDLSAFIKRGILSPVYKIPADRFKELESSTRVDLARAKKPLVPESAICTKPQAYFNQCRWWLSDGHCLRERCNANGEWAEQTPLGSLSACPETGERVKDCDY
jgi:hypothetical protein